MSVVFMGKVSGDIYCLCLFGAIIKSQEKPEWQPYSLVTLLLAHDSFLFANSLKITLFNWVNFLSCLILIAFKTRVV